MVYYCFAYTLQQARDVWCSSFSMLQPYPVHEFPFHGKSHDCKAIPSFSGARISSSAYVARGGEAGRSHRPEVVQGSISLEAGELPVTEKVPLE